MASRPRTAARALLFRRALLLLAALALLGSGRQPPGPEDDEDNFWAEIADPGRRRFRAALERGKKLLDDARVHSRGRTTQVLEQSLAALREAARASPQRSEGHFWMGMVLSFLDRPNEAVKALERARKLEPLLGSNEDVLDVLAVSYSKLGEQERAIQAYDRLEALLTGPGHRLSSVRTERARLHSNAAECLMALGRLDEAIERYRLSLSLRSSEVLTLWGLAVAYDRDEQVREALRNAQRALDSDPRMSSLTGTNVFFVPQGEIHYYFALGHLARGSFEEARKEWELFLSKLPRSQWAFRARTHLAQLGAVQQSKPGPSRRLAPVPGQRQESIEEQARATARSRVRYYMRSFQRCYNQALPRSPALTGRIKLAIWIKPDGRVARSKVLFSALSHPPLHRCLLQVLSGARFNSFAGTRPLKIESTLDFRPQQ